MLPLSKKERGRHTSFVTIPIARTGYVTGQRRGGWAMSPSVVTPSPQTRLVKDPTEVCLEVGDNVRIQEVVK